MKEQLISFETAKLAKEKGFTEECLHFYCKNKVCDHIEEPYEYGFRVNGNKDSKDNLGYGITWSAPTQSLLQKWLREKHDINLRVASNSKTSHFPVNELLGLYKTIGYNQKDTKIYKTYEEALEQGLQEALKLI